jgi:hypothetical protein
MTSLIATLVLFGLGLASSLHAATFDENAELASTWGEKAEAQLTVKHHFVYLDVTRFVTAIVGSETPLIGAHYEYLIGTSGFSLLGALRAGYLLSDNEEIKAFGGGFGLRYYLNHLGEGPFLQGFADGGESRSNQSPRLRYGNFGFEYGYKLNFSDFLLSVHGGPQFYGFTDSKEINMTFGFDLGFPLSARSFDLP